MDEIITMQCGPVRYRVETAPEERYVQIHRTEFRTEISGEEPSSIQDIYNELAVDEDRNQLIVELAKRALGEGRRCLALVNRRAALNVLAEKMRDGIDAPVFEMHGGQKPAVRAELLKELDELGATDRPYVLIAMGKVAGEGLDLPGLNTLILAASISFKGVVIHQTERITRNVSAELEDSVLATKESGVPTVVHDLVDDRVPLLARMHGRRLRAMKKEGFEVMGSEE